MNFVVDTVSEHTYFQNMLLGLADALNKCIGVKRTFLKKLTPLTDTEISLWEEQQKVTLPKDFRLFYLSSNGYKFEWTFAMGDEKVMGSIAINPLEDVAQVYGYETTNDPGVNTIGERYVLKLAPESKIFQLMVLPERAKVVLVYIYPNYWPSIWVLTSSMSFYFLAYDLTTYFRMAIAHLGIPNWQLAYTPEGVPEWSEAMFRLLVPHLLPLKSSLEMMRRQRRGKTDKDFLDVPINKFDTQLFTVLPRPGPPLLPVPDSKLKKKEQSLLEQLKQLEPVQVRTPKKFKRKPLYYIRKR